MTGAITGDLAGDVANQGLQKNTQITLCINMKNKVSKIHRNKFQNLSHCQTYL